MNAALKGWMKTAAAKLQEAAHRGHDKAAFAPGAMFDPAQQQQGGMPPGGAPPMDPAMMGGAPPPQGGMPPGGDPAAMGGGQDPIAMLMQSIDQINQKVDSMAGGGMAGGAMGAPKPPKIDVPMTLQTILQRLDTQNKMLAALCTTAGVEFQAKDLLPPEIGGEPGMQPVMEQPQPAPAGQQKAASAVSEMAAVYKLFKAIGALD